MDNEAIKVPGGSLRFYGGWYGRPNDIIYTITSFEWRPESLVVVFGVWGATDLQNEYHIIHPEGIINQRDHFAIKQAKEIQSYCIDNIRGKKEQGHTFKRSSFDSGESYAFECVAPTF